MPSTLRLTLQQGEDFIKQIRAAMEDELEIASGKWGVRLTDEQRAGILEAAFKQLRLRVESVSNEAWEFTSEVKYSFAGSRGSFIVPSAEASASHIRLVRASDGWQVDQDRREDSVKIGEFLPVARNEIMTWARTAVFYGVGSYKN